MSGRVDNAVVYQAAALVLSYPDERVLASVDAVAAALAGTWAEPLFAPVLAHLRDGEPMELEAYHVAEFDQSRRHALHLSYWTAGDTRRRGEVLASIKQIYRDSGLLVQLDGELPDFLPVILELAVVDPGRGEDLLATYRPSLELLRLELTDDGVPHAGVLQAICHLLPGPAPRTRDEVHALVSAVAPVESVGLEPYGAEPSIAFLGLPKLQRS